MRYAIVDDNMIIVNVIECDNDEDAKDFGALPVDDSCGIGSKYLKPMTELDRFDAQVTYTAMMTNTLLQEG